MGNASTWRCWTLECRPPIEHFCLFVPDVVDWMRCPSYGGNGHGHWQSIFREPLLHLQNVSVWPLCVKPSSLSFFPHLFSETTCHNRVRACVFQYCRRRIVLSLSLVLAVCAADPRLLLSSCRETVSPRHDQGISATLINDHRVNEVRWSLLNSVFCVVDSLCSRWQTCDPLLTSPSVASWTWL